jgi:ABC-type branched-subunit amino acid transport system ATPase component
MIPLLEVSGLSVRFGGLVALQDVSFGVRGGEAVGLIGPNGAGKTTLIDAVSGFVAYEGSVSVAGKRIDGLRPHQRAAQGLGRTFQSLELFDDLTVRENAMVGAHGSESAADKALGGLGIDYLAEWDVSTLDASTQRLVALARALAGQPRVLLVDEVAAGLDDGERDSLSDHLRGITSSGCSVVLVDHDLGLVTSVCERVVVLDSGRVIAIGSPAEIASDERVQAAYLGRRT